MACVVWYRAQRIEEEEKELDDMEETIMFLHQSIMESHRTLQKYLTRSSETRKRIHAVH